MSPPSHALTGLATYAVRFPSGELVRDPQNWLVTTYSLSETYVWLWLIDESDAVRAERLVAVKRQLHYPPSGALTAVRARP